jgi:TRAP-type C4-dicarboxylate transport system permease small subunit
LAGWDARSHQRCGHLILGVTAPGAFVGSLIARLKRGAELIAASMFAIMFGAFIIQVVSRYVFNDPVSWSLEICSLSYIWIVFFASATILTPRQHITFDMLYGSMSPRWKRRFAIFTTGSIFTIFLICLPTTIGYVLYAARMHSLILHIRMDIVYSCFAIFMIGAIVSAGLRLRRLFGQNWPSEI